jgi:hypothetical protein
MAAEVLKVATHKHVTPLMNQTIYLHFLLKFISSLTFQSLAM